jgi:hypothetical protein
LKRWDKSQRDDPSRNCRNTHHWEGESKERKKAEKKGEATTERKVFGIRGDRRESGVTGRRQNERIITIQFALSHQSDWEGKKGSEAEESSTEIKAVHMS